MASPWTIGHEVCAPWLLQGHDRRSNCGFDCPAQRYATLCKLNGAQLTRTSKRAVNNCSSVEHPRTAGYCVARRIQSKRASTVKRAPRGYHSFWLVRLLGLSVCIPHFAAMRHFRVDKHRCTMEIVMSSSTKGVFGGYPALDVRRARPRQTERQIASRATLGRHHPCANQLCRTPRHRSRTSSPSTRRLPSLTATTQRGLNKILFVAATLKLAATRIFMSSCNTLQKEKGEKTASAMAE